MNDLELLVKSYLAAGGMKKVVLRAGSGQLQMVSFSGVLPLIAYQVNIRSRILLGVRPIDCVVISDRRNFCLKFDSGAELLNSEAALQGIAWFFADLESHGENLTILDELTTRYVERHDGELPEQLHINDAMLSGYDECLSEYVQSLATQPASSMEAI